MALAFASSSGGGGGSGVQSVTAGDTSIVVGGTATNPTVETADLATIAADHATSGNVALNSHKITGLANGTAATDAAAFGQIPTVPVSSVFGRTGAVVAANGDYNGVVASALTGATQATRYVGATTSGAPASGTFAVGDFVVAQNGHIFVCTVAGTPGTWADVGGTSGVSSVFGRSGAVVATTGDYTLNQIGAATADYSINSHRLTNLTDPSSAQDAATKHYVDAAVPGNAGGKGHLTTATAVNTPADLAPGSDGTALIADSSQSVGLRYAGSGSKQVRLPLDVPDSSGNGYAALVAGSNIRTLRAAYTNGVDGFWYGILDVPTDYNSGAAIVLWVAANDTTGQVSRWIVGTNPDSTSATFDAAYTAETAQNLTMSTTAYRPAALTFTLSTTPVAGNALAFYIERNGANAADTLTVAAVLFKAVFQYSI